jgi:hypothetical protein
MIEHAPGCGVWGKGVDRVCSCNVRFPFPMLSDWSNWMQLTPAEQAERRQRYKDKIRFEAMRLK